MKKLLLTMSIFMMSLFQSCVEEVSVGGQELNYDILYELKAEMVRLLDTAVIGEVDGTYPQDSYDDLYAALEDLKLGISKAKAGVFILQFEIDNYALAAQKAIKSFQDSIIKAVEPGTPAELFVNGIDHKGYIDFGSSPNFNPSALTVETWIKYPEGFIEFTYGSFISTFVSPVPYKGWALHFWGTSNSLIRMSYGSDDPDVNLTLPTIYTTAPETWNEWFHLAAVIDPSSHTLSLYINGELKSSAKVASNLVPGTTQDECRMWGFVEPKDQSRCMSGYIKKFRLWSCAKTAEELKTLMDGDVKGDEPNLVCAWDFTNKPEDDGAIADKTGQYTAKLVGKYKWTALAE